MSMSNPILWCFVLGNDRSFFINSSGVNFIAGLKPLIKTTKSLASEVDIQDATLWKPLKPILLKPTDSFSERVGALFDKSGRPNPDTMMELPESDSVAATFKNREDGTLDIVVVLSTHAQANPLSTPLHIHEDQRPSKRRRVESNKSDMFNGNTVLSHTPTKSVADVQKNINPILDRVRPVLQKLVAKAEGTPFLPLWIPATEDVAFRNHVEALKIPDNDGLPSLLLHELGSSTSVVNQNLPINDIFSSHDHTVVINTAGSGKTRLGLHGLCRYWGFYGVIVQDVDEIGSRDLQEMMSGLDESLGYKSAHDLTEQGNMRGVDHMHQKVEHRVLQFLLARFLLLNVLIEEAFKCGGLRPSQHRLLWVLLQARPIDMLNEDVFAELARAVRFLSIDDLRHQIRERYADFKHVLEREPTGQTPSGIAHRPLYCFIDEIQQTTSSRMGEYLSQDGETKRPLLRPIWKSLTGVFGRSQFLVILSGTAISEKSLRAVLSSSAFKPEKYTIQKYIGAFDDPDIQKAYIEHYLPPLPDDNSQSEISRQELCRRAWGWCRGRYRSTATLITWILAKGPHSPHKILNSYVKRSTGFLPTDSDGHHTNEPDIDELELDKEKELFDFNRLNGQQANLLRDILYGQIVHGSYHLSPFLSKKRSEELKAFIEYGLARTKSKEEDVLDEPLIIVAALIWSDNIGHQSLLDRLQHDIEKHTPRKNGFEVYLAFYFRKIFENPARLNEVLTFRSDFARRADLDLSWQGEQFELVTVSISEGTKQPTVSVVGPSCGPSSNVGFLAKTDDDVVNWVSENKGFYAFCFTTTYAGPDFFFFVRNKATGELLLVAVQAKKHKDITPQVLTDGVQTITPSFFWTSKGAKEGIASSFLDALMKIGHTITIRHAPYPILRLFASWEDAKLKRILEVKEGKHAAGDDGSVGVVDPDPHPLATLHLGNFKYIGGRLIESWENEAMDVVALAKSENNGETVRKSTRLQTFLAR